MSLVAVVTGAARGIGHAIALRLAHDGLNVVLNDLPIRSQELEKLAEEIRAIGADRKCVIAIGDVSREEDVQKVVDAAVDQLGSLDVMVANAGIARATPLVAMSLEDWDAIQSVNIRGVFMCYRAAAVQMIKQGRGGRIIGAGSVAGKRGSAGASAYCASKFAVRGLTQSAADELKRYGITVNAYAPGIVETPLWDDVAASREKYGLEKRNYLQDPIAPADIAGLVSYLVREESRFVTGQSISINGGLFFD